MGVGGGGAWTLPPSVDAIKFDSHVHFFFKMNVGENYMLKGICLFNRLG